METFTIVTQLKVARDFYYKGKPIMTDLEFDKLEAKLRELDPNNDYFKTVGTTNERGTKVKHRIPMGSLNQVSCAAELRRWGGSKADVVASDKLDGNSIAISYDENGDFESAATRGDGIEGLDITRHVRRMLNRPNPPIPSNIGAKADIRCEAIFAKDLFVQHVTGYKNPRNYVAGQLNRAVADQTFIDHVSLVAFDAVFPGSEHLSKHLLFKAMIEMDFEVVHHFQLTVDDADDDFLESLLETRKSQSPYELDGLVIEFNDPSIRKKLGFDYLNPNFATKYKINVNFVETEVIRVDWNPSKDGYMKPRVQFEPIDLAGVTINFATGFNAKFIMDNKIGPGAIIKVTRSGDVIPFIQEVIKGTEADLPENFNDKCYWSETGVDLILKEKPDESIIKEMVDFFTNIDAPHLKIGNVTALYEAGFTTIEKIIKMTEEEMVVVLGEKGYKTYSGLREKLIGIDEYILAGSLPFFGRGVGRRKMKVLAEAYGDITKLTYEQILDTAGFEEITADKIFKAIPRYVEFLNEMADYISVKKYEKVSGDLNGIAVCFTGVRSKELETIIEQRGGKILSSATKQMTHLVAKDPNGKSGKLNKARAAGVTILSLEEANKMWNNG